jgi:hypothetical protein
MCGGKVGRGDELYQEHAGESHGGAVSCSTTSARVSSAAATIGGELAHELGAAELEQLGRAVYELDRSARASSAAEGDRRRTRYGITHVICRSDPAFLTCRVNSCAHS